MNDYLQTKELYHHGIKGMKWGIRRYQNEDGTLTEEGKKRYSENVSSYKSSNIFEKYARDLIKKNTNLLNFAKEIPENTNWYEIEKYAGYIKHKFPKEENKEFNN